MKQSLLGTKGPDLLPLFTVVESELEQVRLKYRDLVRSALSSFSQTPDERTESPFDLAREIGEHMLRGEGKWLRAGLTLLVAKGLGIDMIPAVNIATAIEIAHTATLIHDDVLDESNLRRGHPSIPSVWGNAAAVLGGDILLSVAYDHLIHTTSQECQQDIAKSVIRVCLGEIAQQKSSQLVGLSEDSYLDIIERKTASLFVSCVRCPALMAQVDEHDLSHLTKFGSSFGIAFQIVDDLMDFLSSADDMGKPAGRDSRQGKPTLAMIHFLRCHPETEAKAFDFTFSDWKDHLEESGSFKYAAQAAERFALEAMRALHRVQGFTHDEARETLNNVLRYSTSRIR